MRIAIRLDRIPPPPPDLPLQKTAVALTQTSSAWGRLPSSMEINENLSSVEREARFISMSMCEHV